MLTTDSKVATVSFYINGAWEAPRGRTMGTVTNPGGLLDCLHNART